jgi:predicted aldo/keto reductase-like oxidoreductase
MVGKALKGRRDQVYLSTKNPCWQSWGNGPWRERLETQLTKLDTDYIDFYAVVHGLSWEGYTEHFTQPGGGWEACLQAREEGLIRHLCMSCHDTPENMIKLIDEGWLEGMIIQYNLLDRRNEPAIQHAYEKGVAVCVMGPVGGGRLAHPSEQISRMAGGQALSVPDLALRFVLANPYVTMALSGMNTMQQIDENVATCSREAPLSAQELQAVRNATEESKRLADLYCTGCRYCLPCEQGVAIPEIFSMMNNHRVWGLTDLARQQYANLGPENKDGQRSAEACVECGECEKKCPQNIEIIRQLKESHEALS